MLTIFVRKSLFLSDVLGSGVLKVILWVMNYTSIMKNLLGLSKVCAAWIA
jgi:hypothetical protein